MAIKYVLFTNLVSNAFAYTAIGGIRLYDGAGNKLLSGAVISSGLTVGESDNFKAYASSTYGSEYNVLNAFDTNKPETGVHADGFYWLQSGENHTLRLEFKTPVSNISKVTFNPLPPSGYVDRGTDTNIRVEFRDESFKYIKAFNVTPITTRNTVQTLPTPGINLVSSRVRGGASETEAFTGKLNSGTLIGRLDKSHVLGYNPKFNINPGAHMEYLGRADGGGITAKQLVISPLYATSDVYFANGIRSTLLLGRLDTSHVIASNSFNGNEFRTHDGAQSPNNAEASGIVENTQQGVYIPSHYFGEPLIYIWKGVEYGTGSTREVLLYRNEPNQWHPLHVNRDNTEATPTKPYKNLKPHWGK